MYQLSVTSHFDAAHYLRGYNGPCSSLHGHTFDYTVTIEGDRLDDLGMLIDFKAVKSRMKEVIEVLYDHTCLNDLKDFSHINPTAENLAEVIYVKMSDYFNVVKVSVNESRECQATYFPSDKT